MGDCGGSFLPFNMQLIEMPEVFVCHQEETVNFQTFLSGRKENLIVSQSWTGNQ